MKLHTLHLTTVLCFVLFNSLYVSCAPSTAVSLIDSPLRWKEPLKPEEIEKLVFGLRFDELDLEAECHVDVDVQWYANIGASTIAGPPLIGDFRNDGKKELAVVSSDEFVEVVEGEDGRKEPGWPFFVPERRFPCGAVDYDLSGTSTRDLLVTTDKEIFFLTEDGYPYHGATLKPPPLAVDKEWFVPFKQNNQTLYEALYSQLPLKNQRIRECEENAKKFIQVYEKHREQMSAQYPSGEFKMKYKEALSEHIKEQTEKVDKHVNRIKNMFDRRKLLANDDDLEDDAGTKFETISQKLSAASHTFDGVEGWLTRDGVESLELFLPTETGSSFVTQLRSAADPLFSPQNEAWLEIQDLDEFDPTGRQTLLEGRFQSAPVVVDLEGDGHNEIIVAVNYVLSVDEIIRTKNDPDQQLNPAYYAASAIVAYDMMIHQVKWISPLELSSNLDRFRAVIMSTPTVIDFDGDGELNIIFGTAMGHIYVLDNFGCLVPGFPVAMSSIVAPVVVEDIDQDGKLDLIAVDIVSTIAVFDQKGKMKWSTPLAPGCASAPTIADVDGNEDLDLVISCNSGVLHVLDCYGARVKPFPILQEPGVRGSALVLDLLTTPGLHIVSMTASGHLYVTDGITACTEVVDLGASRGPRVPMVLADDITGNGMMDLVVTSGQSAIYTLSTDMPYHPLNAWTKEAHGRNVFTTTLHQGVFFSQLDRRHRDVVGSSFWMNFEIVDRRKTRTDAYYDVQIKLRRDLDPIFAGRYSTPGIKTVELPAPSERMSGTLRIEMTNEHQQFFQDSITLTFNMSFYRSIKWVIILPFSLCCVFVFYLKQEFERMQIDI